MPGFQPYTTVYRPYTIRITKLDTVEFFVQDPGKVGLPALSPIG